MWLRQHCEAESGGERSHPPRKHRPKTNTVPPTQEARFCAGAVETPTGEVSTGGERAVQMVFLFRHTLFSFLCSVIV